MSPSLLILAAGMGSRYGGLKQLDPVGPSGETLLDYSVFDAVAINADDFYGAGAYQALAGFFAQTAQNSDIPSFAMVGYRLGHTLSEHGSVARGVCSVDDAGFLQKIEECTGIEKTDSGARLKSPEGLATEFSGNETVSMNFWGFTPAIFPRLEEGLKEFLSRHADDEKAEFYIPVAVAGMIASESARVRVLSSDSSWFGVTYREDKLLVSESIARLVKAGEYPQSLWIG